VLITFELGHCLAFSNIRSIHAKYALNVCKTKGFRLLTVKRKVITI